MSRESATNLLLKDLLGPESLNVERAAMLLAMTTTRESENALKDYLAELGFLCGVTEVTGKSSEVSDKLFHNVLGVALNLKVIEKTPQSIHALVHATHEACVGINFDVWLSTNYRLKSVVVTKDHWLAISLCGFAATHQLTNHTRIGLGAMHI